MILNAPPLKGHERHMTARLESMRKDVERLFGSLKDRFKVVRQEPHKCSDEMIMRISNVCIILHKHFFEMV